MLSKGRKAVYFMFHEGGLHFFKNFLSPDFKIIFLGVEAKEIITDGRDRKGVHMLHFCRPNPLFLF